ncbi:MAG: hypothetical protein MHM6MM_005014 [Cercozoa sp. M6MM]
MEWDRSLSESDSSGAIRQNETTVLRAATENAMAFLALRLWKLGARVYDPLHVKVPSLDYRDELFLSSLRQVCTWQRIPVTLVARTIENDTESKRVKTVRRRYSCSPVEQQLQGSHGAETQGNQNKRATAMSLLHEGEQEEAHRLLSDLVEANEITLVHMLLRLGADPHYQDFVSKDGHTALWVSQHCDCPREMRQALQSHSELGDCAECRNYDSNTDNQ